jgi:hypothetical protein
MLNQFVSDPAMRRAAFFCVFVALFAIGLAIPASAGPVTYTYTGEPLSIFSGTFSCAGGVGECEITGSFTVPTALPDDLTFPTLVTPTSYSFTDGAQTLTNLNSAIGNFSSTLLDFVVSTGPTGEIENWSIGILSTKASPDGFEFFMDNFSIDTEDAAYTYNLTPPIMTLGKAVSDSAGSWSSSLTSVPEPSYLPLLGTGLLFAVAVARIKLRGCRTRRNAVSSGA